MRSKLLLWLVALLIGAAFAFPPVIFAAEKAAQPCAPADTKKEEKKEKKAAKKKVEKKAEKKEEGMMKEGKMEEKKK